MAAANRFLEEQFTPAYNTEFQVTAAVSGSAFVPLLDTRIEDILCLQEERTVGRDNCARYQRKILQIPTDQHRNQDKSGQFMCYKNRIILFAFNIRDLNMGVIKSDAINKLYGARVFLWG